MKKIFFAILFLIVFQSCELFNSIDEDREIVARVNDIYLYKDNLKDVITVGADKQDSTLIVSNFINNWVKQQLLLSKAKLNLVDESRQYEKLVEKYRQDLYINAYKEAAVKSYLDTEISKYDIIDFYEKNKSSFLLNEDLVKLKYLKIDKTISNKDELMRLFNSDENEDKVSLQNEELALKSFFLNDSIWVKYQDVLVEVPILKAKTKKDVLKPRYYLQEEDSINLYLLKIEQVLKQGEMSPLNYISPTIKQMILHQRKLLLIRNIEETLIEDANKRREFEIY